MTPNTLAEEMNYKLDLKKTLLSNIFWFLILGVIVAFVFLAFDKINSFEDEHNRLLAIIVFMFMTVKLLMWNSHPRIYFREKDKGVNQ